MGFNSDWVYPYGTKDVRLSTFRVSGNYHLWSLMRELDKYESKEVEEDKYSEYLVRICTEQTMKFFSDDLKLYEVFQWTHSLVYGYEFCKEDNHNLPTFLLCTEKDISKEDKLEDKLKKEIEDFAARVAMDSEAQRRFCLEMKCLYNGRIDQNGFNV